MACSLFPWCWHERKKQCHCWIISLILKEPLTFDFDFDFDFFFFSGWHYAFGLLLSWFVGSGGVFNSRFVLQVC